MTFGFVSDFGFRVSTLVCSWRPLPRGVRPWGSYSACVEINTPRGEVSFIRYPKPKFNGKFQICSVSFLIYGGSVFWSIPRLVIVGHCLSRTKREARFDSVL